MPVTPLPVPGNRNTDTPQNFSDKMDLWTSRLTTLTSEINGEIAGIIQTTAVPIWSATTSYSLGNAVYSPITQLTYRLRVSSLAGNAANADPSNDTTNWRQVTGTGNVSNDTAASFTNLTATGTTSLQSVGVNGAYASNIVSVAAASIDLSLGNYFSTGGVTTAVTYTIVNPPAARAYSFTLEANIGTGGAITFPASVVWPNGVTPTFTAGKTALITFVTDNGGTTYRASAITGYTT